MNCTTRVNTPTCPYRPQQAVNALKAAITRPELISLEIIDTQANPKPAEKDDAFSVPVCFANEVMIARGGYSSSTLRTLAVRSPVEKGLGMKWKPLSSTPRCAMMFAV